MPLQTRAPRSWNKKIEHHLTFTSAAYLWRAYLTAVCSSSASKIRTNQYQSALIYGSMISASEDLRSMTCSGCGAYVTPSVRFCSNCGSATTHPEATKTARMKARAFDYNANTDREEPVFTFPPTMIFV